MGVSPHATWEDKHGGGHVNLLGVAGARLVVDEALRLRAERATSRLELHAEADGLDGVGELHLTVHKGDTEVGRLTLTRTPAFLDLGSVRAGEEFGLGAVLSIPSHSTRGGRVLVRLWIEAGPDQGS